jgi:hypothetical protein
MRKLINVSMALVTMFGITLALSGCTEETGTKTETKVTTPEGTTTRRTTDTVDTSGKNPPSTPAPGDTSKP